MLFNPWRSGDDHDAALHEVARRRVRISLPGAAPQVGQRMANTILSGAFFDTMPLRVQQGEAKRWSILHGQSQ